MKSKFCLTSVASFKEINGSLTNRSKSKQTFSFNKTPRFDSIRSICDKITYGGDYVKKRGYSAGIGYGERSDFTKNLTNAPSSNKYKISSFFDQNKQKKRGNSMGLSRNAVSFNNYIPKQNLNVPPSTKYQTEKVQKYRAPSFSLRQRTKIMDRSMTLDPEIDNPGPAYYNEEKGLKSTKHSKISYSSSKQSRFLSSSTNVPGVGQYENAQSISNIGRYSNSKHFGGTQAKFGRNLRATFLDETMKNQKGRPGPGHYKSTSQFGQYDGDVYSTALSRFSKRN